MLLGVFCFGGVYCCGEESIVAGAIYCSWQWGVFFTALLAIITKFHKKLLATTKMILGSVVSKRGITGRWVEVETRGDSEGGGGGIPAPII